MTRAIEEPPTMIWQNRICVQVRGDVSLRVVGLFFARSRTDLDLDGDIHHFDHELGTSLKGAIRIPRANRERGVGCQREKGPGQSERRACRSERERRASETAVDSRGAVLVCYQDPVWSDGVATRSRLTDH